MEERQFLHKLCAIALQVDISIEFAGILDSNGKLLVGKSRNKFSYHDIYKKKEKINIYKEILKHMVKLFLRNRIFQ